MIGGFANDGPERCSGLPVARREAVGIAELFGSGFEFVAETREQHVTPSGATQSFAYTVLRKLDRYPAESTMTDGLPTDINR